MLTSWEATVRLTPFSSAEVELVQKVIMIFRNSPEKVRESLLLHVDQLFEIILKKPFEGFSQRLQ